MADERFIGRVKFFNTGKGFGFIYGPADSEPDDRQDYYFHFSDIQPSSSNYPVRLHTGEYVEYTLSETGYDDPKKKFKATEITGPYGGPLMMDARRPPTSRRRRSDQNYREDEDGNRSDS